MKARRSEIQFAFVLIVAISMLPGCRQAPVPARAPTLPVILGTTPIPAITLHPIPTIAPTARAQVVVPLGPGRDSSQTGTVILTENAGHTNVVVSIQPGPAGVGQPAHIHDGPCPGTGAVKYPLSNVTDGKSITTINAPLEELLHADYSLNVHKSTLESNIYVSCGEIN